MKNRIQIIKGDITHLEVDAIVNAANNTLSGGGGVDGAIHRAAGPELLEACKPLGGCATGDAKLTPGFNLKAKYVIHTVGPIWLGGSAQEKELLASVYRRSLEVAKENALETIAFPSISTGIYRFPFALACKIAIREILNFLEASETPSTVFLVTFTKEDFMHMTHIMKSM